jgi:hypothetical protein
MTQSNTRPGRASVALGALDKLGLIVLPFLLGEGMQLTPSLSTDTGLTLESKRALCRRGASALDESRGPIRS